MNNEICTYVQSDQSRCWSLEYSMSVKLLIEHHLKFLSLKGGCICSSESSLVKRPHCWKSNVAAHTRKTKKQSIYSTSIALLIDQAFSYLSEVGPIEKGKKAFGPSKLGKT